ncbi:hypothetical protein TSTA_094620 [Talaromyces stipitatus ATCC 10500]|uniref:Sugar transporter n=1 Tax=Talaromyces stipitatus (strain ATCC 10500 / CBS 375.48 / QM 6759 / NRRL 1006) TaxID=441959 RepID=B8M2W1_TALSN|nr:uncharacterized protein TSTA_094620 [Talaromyces stipitatus ATCC 10500]EED22216.1 hypothetical protein TSTA_094620 [Talaromyces stipitatus ATCC 10500]
MVLQIFAVVASVLLGNKLSRQKTLLVSTSMIFVPFMVIGCIGRQKYLSTTSKYSIVFSYVVICAYNIAQGPLTYAITRELSVGVNQNQIMSVSNIALYFFLWLISFTAPYLYNKAGLGPMVCFVYAGLTLTSLAWGRTQLEITAFFTEAVPARKWSTHGFARIGDGGKEKLGSVEKMNVHHVEVAKDAV